MPRTTRARPLTRRRAAMGGDARGAEDPSDDEYEHVSYLGQGSFGRVALVRRKSDGEPLVVKTLLLHRETMTREDLFNAENEVEVLRLVAGHLNVTNLVDARRAPDGRHFRIVQEHCDEGTLDHRIAAWRGGSAVAWDEHDVLHLFSQLCLAVRYLHALDVLHRDIKPANVMLARLPRGAARDDADVLVVKLGDFGLSRVLAPGAEAHAHVGTPHYLSPEIVEGRGYDHRSDVWALGCCLHEALVGRRPFESQTRSSRDELRLAIARGEYERVPVERAGGQLRRLVDRCLSYAPEDRPGVEEILKTSCVRAAGRKFRELARRAGVDPGEDPWAGADSAERRGSEADERDSF